MRVLTPLIATLLCAALFFALPPAYAASSLAYQSDRMTARLITAENAVTPNAGTLSAALQVTLAKGWKTYWKAPGSVGYAPDLDWAASSNIANSNILYPAPTRFEAFEIENYGYADEVTFPIQLTLDKVGETTVLNLSANLLVCHELCIPELFDLNVTLLAGETGVDISSASAIAEAAAQVPTPVGEAGMRDPKHWMSADKTELQISLVSDAGFSDALQVFPDMGPDATFGAPAFSYSADRTSVVATLPVLSAPQSITSFDVVFRDGSRAALFTAGDPAATPLMSQAAESSLWGIVLIALLGGLILNIMPCVLPVLTIKFASALKSSDQSPARIRTGFLVSALGVLTFMWALVAVLLSIRAGGGQIGWGVQFQNPVFLGVMVALIMLFAANLAGLFEFRLPQRLNTSMSRIEGGTGLWGDFCTGALAAVLATPCSAPFLGTAVTFALAGSAMEAVATFTALGVGLAAPYLLIALRPSWVQALPKPGPWMVWVKWVMAGLLALTALWLSSVLLTVAGWQVILAFWAFLLAALVALKLPVGSSLRWAAPAALVAVALLMPAVLRPSPQAVEASADWAVFQETAIREAVAQGDVVFVDVTASWCLTCKANKARVLDRAPVSDRLRADGVTAMRADWTQPDPAILSFLKSNGRFGIPFNIVYGPNAPDGIALPEFLTKELVLTALDAAKS